MSERPRRTPFRSDRVDEVLVATEMLAMWQPYISLAGEAWCRGRRSRESPWLLLGKGLPNRLVTRNRTTLGSPGGIRPGASLVLKNASEIARTERYRRLRRPSAFPPECGPYSSAALGCSSSSRDHGAGSIPFKDVGFCGNRDATIPRGTCAVPGIARPITEGAPVTIARFPARRPPMLAGSLIAQQLQGATLPIPPESRHAPLAR
jgi:hypothetical protein